MGSLPVRCSQWNGEALTGEPVAQFDTSVFALSTGEMIAEEQTPRKEQQINTFVLHITSGNLKNNMKYFLQ